MAEAMEPTGRRRSRSARRFGRFLRRSWQALVVGLLAIAMGVAAILSPGLVQADVRLDEGTIYAGNGDAGLIGTVNAQIDELSAATATGTTSFEILQEQDAVFVHALNSSSMVGYNPGRNRMESPAQLPTNASVVMGRDLLAVTSQDNGSVWYGDIDSVMQYDFQAQEADLEIGEFGLTTITSEDQVISLNVQTSTLVRPGDQEEVVTTDLPFTIDPDAPDVQLSAVGDRAVVLDRVSGRIWVEGMSTAFEVSGASSAHLAAPSPHALDGDEDARAIYATRAGLIAVTPDGPRSLSGQLDARPIAPIQVDDCVYAAFGNQFVKRCVGQDAEIRDIPEVPDGAELTFHSNRSTVILNDMASGVIWMVDKDMLMITDWEDVNPPADEQPDNQDVTVEQVIPPDRDADNQDPIAEDDHLAARAGRSTVLHVLDNDADPDGDVLTITAPSELTGATLQPVRGGAGLQITLDQEATGDLVFDYSVDDGRGGSDSATVTVRVLPMDPNTSNEAPHKHHLAQPVSTQLGSTVTKRVLLDWRDADGDPLLLEDAWLSPGAEDEVSFTPDGEITFRDIGKTTGTKEIHVEVSDGYETSTDVLHIVVEEDTVAPIAYGDYETVRAGEMITIEPLLNDVGANLSLTEINPGDPCACTTTTNFRENWFTFTSDTPGVYYVTYQVSNPLVAMGLVRIDVLPDTNTQLPVAALDVALLPPGGSVTIDPLLNDTSPSGNVLVVQSVSQSPGLQVVLERRHLVTISSVTRQTEPVTLNYLVSDGRNSVQGSIIVLPTTSTGSVEPQAAPDTVRIRAGSTQSVEVLANDVSPIGLDLQLDSLVENPFDDRAWIDGDLIRVSVPATAGAATSTITYQVRDEEGRVSSAQLSVTVTSPDDQNEAPVPRQVTERLLAGTTSRIAIPLGGIDINGDAVRVVGLGSGPSLGRVMGVGDGWLLYEAFPTSQGTDSFRYQVTDSLGAIGVGEIRIGVAPPGQQNNPPVGVTDEITVRPGSHVQIPALRNDVDVDGDSIAYASTDPVEMTGVDEVEIVEGREISFTAPAEEGEYRGVYHIEDSRGEPGSGDITLVVDQEAPLQPPEARDDLVPVAAVVGQDWVEIDVTANDFDPDGLPDDLRVTVPDEDAEDELSPRRSDDGRGVIVPVTDHMQQVRYTLVDADDLSTTALVTVPGRGDSVPVLTDPNLNFEVVAGQPLSLTLGAIVSGTQGRSVRLTSVDNVSATHGTVAPGPEKVEYTPERDYAGPASVVFEVADVVPEGDRSGKSAYISVPVKVLPSEQVTKGDDPTDLPEVVPPPELIGEAVLRAGQGEDEVRRDLQSLFRVHTNGNLTFHNFRAGDGDQRITWRADATGMMYAQAPLAVEPGTTLTVHAEAWDALDGKTPFQIRIEVTSSQRPLPVAANISIDEALAGQDIDVPVLAGSHSNLPNNPELHLVGQPTIISGSGSAVYDGDQVSVTPAEGFTGTMTVSYTIVDATMDPNRHADGFIRITVKDRPGRPGAPRDGTAGNGFVTFTYTPGPSNGLEILSRTVIPVRQHDGVELPPQECPSTTCTVTNLPNGVAYQFTMVETNAAGASDPSPLSAAYTPDQRPLPPQVSITDFGDGSLTATWDQTPSWEDPTNPGSPITGYTLYLVDDQGSTIANRAQSASASSYEWTGLTNGTRYRFRISATNQAGASEVSGASEADWPAAPPAAPTNVVAVPTEDALGGAFQVSWDTAIPNNGDPISSFLVTPQTRQGALAPIEVAAGSGGRATVSVSNLRQVEYTFSVTAVNKAGAGAAGNTGRWQVPWRLPSVTGELSVTRAAPGAIAISMTTDFDSETLTDVQRQYRLNGGSWNNLPGDGVVSGLVNGREYVVEVRVAVESGTRISQARGAGGVMPRSEAPTWPGITDSKQATSEDTVRIGLTAKPTDWELTGGWDPDGYRFRCEACGGDWTTQRTFNSPHNATVTVQMTHTDHEGSTSASTTNARVFDGSWNSTTRMLNATLRYSAGGHCQIRAAGMEAISVSQPSGSQTFVIADQLQLPEEVVAEQVTVRCSTNELRNVDFTVGSN